MPKHIETLLTNIGITPEDATAIVESTDDMDVSQYVEKVKTNYKTQLQNDPEFFAFDKLPADVKKKIESGQYARATNVTKEKLAKALGFTPEEIKDLETDDFKALDYYVPAIADKWTKGKSGDKEIQAQLIDARKQLEKFDGMEERLKMKYESETGQKIASVIFNASVLSELAAIPGLKISATDIAKTANEILQSKYAFERVGDYSIELRQKSNPTMKVLKPNSSKELTLKEAIQEIVKERAWAADVDEDDDGADKNRSGKVKIVPDKGKLSMIAPHLQDKISKKIAAEAAAQ